MKILDNGNYHISILSPVHVHIQVLIYLTPKYFGPVAKYTTYTDTESCEEILLNLGYLQIIYVPTHGRLGTIYQFISHTWVIWVHFEPFSLQMDPELLVKQHGTSKNNVEIFG